MWHATAHAQQDYNPPGSTSAYQHAGPCGAQEPVRSVCIQQSSRCGCQQRCLCRLQRRATHHLAGSRPSCPEQRCLQQLTWHPGWKHDMPLSAAVLPLLLHLDSGCLALPAAQCGTSQTEHDMQVGCRCIVPSAGSRGLKPHTEHQPASIGLTQPSMLHCMHLCTTVCQADRAEAG